MIERLNIIENRYNELNAKLMDPEVLSNVKKTTELSKEASSLEETVNSYKEYKGVLEDIESAKEMLKDPDMADFAKEELE